MGIKPHCKLSQLYWTCAHLAGRAAPLIKGGVLDKADPFIPHSGHNPPEKWKSTCEISFPTYCSGKESSLWQQRRPWATRLAGKVRRVLQTEPGLQCELLQSRPTASARPTTSQLPLELACSPQEVVFVLQRNENWSLSPHRQSNRHSLFPQSLGLHSTWPACKYSLHCFLFPSVLGLFIPNESKFLSG